MRSVAQDIYDMQSLKLCCLKCPARRYHQTLLVSLEFVAKRKISSKWFAKFAYQMLLVVTSDSIPPLLM